MNAFFELVRDIPAPFNMVVIIVAISCTAGLLGGFAKQVRIYMDHEADRRLKRDMIDSGFAVEDAQRLADMHVTEDFDAAKHAQRTA